MTLSFIGAVANNLNLNKKKLIKDIEKIQDNLSKEIDKLESWRRMLLIEDNKK